MIALKSILAARQQASTSFPYGTIFTGMNQSITAFKQVSVRKFVFFAPALELGQTLMYLDTIVKRHRRYRSCDWSDPTLHLKTKTKTVRILLIQRFVLKLFRYTLSDFSTVGSNGHCCKRVTAGDALLYPGDRVMFFIGSRHVRTLMTSLE